MESSCSVLLLLSEVVLLLAKFTIAQYITGFDGNSTRIEGQSSFSRQCVYRGEESQLMQLEWEFNGTVIYHTSKTVLLLTIDEPSVSDAGEYFCIAVLSDGEHRRTSGGFLLIYSPELVVVPSVHEAVAGDNITLNCSSNIPGTRVRWRRGTSFLSENVLADITPSQSGMSYECVVTEIAGGGLEIYTITSQLHVIVSPTLISITEEKPVYGNEAATFSVSYLSTQSNTSAYWLFDNVPLTSTTIRMITTNEINETLGLTMLQFEQLRRADSGTYTAVVHNSNMIIPVARRTIRVDFRVHVHVPPAPPSQPVITPFDNMTMSTITWNLTNQTADSGPDYLVVMVEGLLVSPRLSPGTTELVIPTEPGRSYSVTIVAYNIDGDNDSPRAVRILDSKAPRLNNLAAFKLNQTSFNISAEVVFTGSGGGELTLINISFREAGTNNAFISHTSPIPLEKIGAMKSYWIITNRQFADIMEVEFSLGIRNTQNLNYTTKLIQRLLVPGPPENVSVISAMSDSLRIQAHLSTVGTAPLSSVHFVVTGPSNVPQTHNVTKNIVPGGLVELKVENLSPDTSYRVVLYATNMAGIGQESQPMTFHTSLESGVLPLWIILVIAVVGSLVMLILLLLLLISCCCRRRNNKKINIPSYNVDRPGPLGASDSVDSIHAESSACYYSQKSIQGFILSPAPPGNHPSSPAISALHTQSISYYDDITKPHLQDSISESECSEQSSKFPHHFNFRHSPVGPHAPNLHFDKSEYSRSMPVLDIDDMELSPTMPPNCATDV